jgi:hypothetical protein
MTTGVIRGIKREQDFYDQDPERYERMERENREQIEMQNQQEREEWERHNEQ